jgi:hypothetical protein
MDTRPVNAKFPHPVEQANGLADVVRLKVAGVSFEETERITMIRQHEHCSASEDCRGLRFRKDATKHAMTVITAAAKETLDASDVQAAIHRHARGDWGELGPSDRAENERALLHEGRLFSRYHDRLATKFYIITEANRSVTTVLLAEDY